MIAGELCGCGNSNFPCFFIPFFLLPPWADQVCVGSAPNKILINSSVWNEQFSVARESESQLTLWDHRLAYGFEVRTRARNASHRVFGSFLLLGDFFLFFFHFLHWNGEEGGGGRDYPGWNGRRGVGNALPRDTTGFRAASLVAFVITDLRSREEGWEHLRSRSRNAYTGAWLRFATAPIGPVILVLLPSQFDMVRPDSSKLRCAAGVECTPSNRVPRAIIESIMLCK